MPILKSEDILLTLVSAAALVHCHKLMIKAMRIRYISHMRPAKALTRLHTCDSHTLSIEVDPIIH